MNLDIDHNDLFIIRYALMNRIVFISNNITDAMETNNPRTADFWNIALVETESVLAKLSKDIE